MSILNQIGAICLLEEACFHNLIEFPYTQNSLFPSCLFIYFSSISRLTTTTTTTKSKIKNIHQQIVYYHHVCLLRDSILKLFVLFSLSLSLCLSHFFKKTLCVHIHILHSTTTTTTTTILAI